MKHSVASEYKEAMALIEWCSYMPLVRDLIIHIPNEGKRTPLQGLYLKRIGLRPGVSDFFLPLPISPYHGLWIELKRTSGGRITPHQAIWIERMKSLDYKAEIAYGWIAARDKILGYLKKSIDI